MKKTLHKAPLMLFSDNNGDIFEEPDYQLAVREGNNITVPDADVFIELPEGSDMFMLPGRFGYGKNIKTGKIELINKGFAVASFISPAYTQIYLAAYKAEKDAPRLPLYAYTAVGWVDGKFYVPAIRIDSDIRQDCSQFDQEIVIRNAKIKCAEKSENRLIKHLSNCALTYFCPAARNYFLKRWEAPLPTSPSCNAQCVGCISYQPKKHKISPTQHRITFVPTPEEIAKIAIEHLETASNPIVSFGQGCEGEPLTVWKIIEQSIKLIRKKTGKGIINLNTNASKPEAIDILAKAGLDSIRVSMNSVREKYYNAYFNPVGYSFTNVIESIRIMRAYNKWVSLNYFVFPGFTDSIEEYETLLEFLNHNKPNMLQWRNMNIDTDWYLEILKDSFINQETIGVLDMISNIKQKFPKIYHGYFNPGKKIQRKYGLT